MSMHTIRQYAGLSLTTALLIGGCGSDGAPSHEQEMAHADPPASLIVPVQVIVLQRGDGSGNALWTFAAMDAMLSAAEDMLRGVLFDIVHDEYLPYDHLYDANQEMVLELLSPDVRRDGMVTIIISGPYTTDYAGFTRTRVNDPRPVIVMRARRQDAEGLSEAPAIFLHELGHAVLGLRHFVQDGQGRPWTTDTYHQTEDGREAMRAALAWLVKQED